MPRKNIDRRTKIVCTLGPASFSEATIERLIRAGMDVARLNLSHGTLTEHAVNIKTLRRLAGRLGVNQAILLDLPGPKYRIGRIKGEQVMLTRGQTIKLTTEPIEGEAGLLPVNMPYLIQDARSGDTVLLDDGAIQLRVKEIQGKEILCHVTVGGMLREGRGLVVPGMHVSAPFVTDALKQAVRFAAEHQPDYLALSFVRTPKNITEARGLLQESGADIPIIAKIEHPEAVRNFDSILRDSDGIMVARGDLGVEIPLEKVPILQKEIIKACNRAGKPVITATEMLESMVESPRPTRAETTDVANAIFDGTDATMLSAETAIGKYPVQSAAMMARIAREAERSLPYERILAERETWLEAKTDELISYDACHTAYVLRAAAIVAFTSSGSTAQRLSKYRPPTPILALTSSEKISRRLALRWGVQPFQVRVRSTVDEMFSTAARAAVELGLAKKGDLIVVTAGIPIGISGTTNLLKVHRIE